MDSKDTLRDILTRMHDLLRGLRDYARSQYLQETLRILERDEDAALASLTGLEFWGGSGSFLDFEVSNYSETTSGDVPADNVRYYSLLLELLTYLQRCGYSEKRVEENTRVLERLISYWSSP